MTHTHMQEVIKDLRSILENGSTSKGFLSALRGGKNTHSHSDQIRSRLSGCVICEQMNNALERYAYTIAQLYSSNAEFKQMFEQSKGFCLPHLALILDLSERTLSSSQNAAFTSALAALELQNLDRIEKELEWFTLKFDYRNTDKPWGNSRDAVERSINKLMGACVGEEAELPAHND